MELSSILDIVAVVSLRDGRHGQYNIRVKTLLGLLSMKVAPERLDYEIGLLYRSAAATYRGV